MGAVVPVLIVVAFWMVVGVVAVWFFGRFLSIPTEMEVEAQLEQAAHAEHKEHAAESGVTTAAH
jgi:hypothetical protein